MIQFYNEELAYETAGKVTQSTLDFDPAEHKTAESAAKGMYEALVKACKAYGQDPAWEVHIKTPEQYKAWGGGCEAWYVSWEAGPWEWAIGASFEATGPGWHTEPYHSFDLVFYDD